MSIHYLYKSTDEIRRIKPTKINQINHQTITKLHVAALNEILNNQQATTQLKDASHQLKLEKFSFTYNEWQRVKIHGSSSMVSKKVSLVASIEHFIAQFSLNIEVPFHSYLQVKGFCFSF